MKNIIKAGLSAIAIAAASTAYAATATTTFKSKIVITAGCSVTATDLDFGSSSLITANIDATSTISVTCTNTTPYTVSLNQGTFGASTTDRKMKHDTAADLISYSMYRDAARSLNWGNLAADWATGTGNGAAQAITVYGRVPAQAGTAPGNYTDTVTVTVTY